jgi:hypothetical protein
VGGDLGELSAKVDAVDSAAGVLPFIFLEVLTALQILVK